MKKIIILIFILSANLFSVNKALVIGNANYNENLGTLKNPVNDAIAIKKTLSEIGFDVITIFDGNERDIKESIRNFRNSLEVNDTALFYYAGHGVQIDGINYIIPIDSNVEYEKDVEYEAINMDYIMTSLENSKSRRNILFFDACRNNNLKKDSRSGKRGLAITQRKLKESIIIYSTSPGEIAYDGDGENSPFAQSLITNIRIPNLTLNSILMRITKDVQIKNENQIPWRSSSLTEEIYFVKDSSFLKNELSEMKISNVFGSFIVNVKEAGDLYINNNKIAEFKKNESKKIDNIATGQLRLKYMSNGGVETKTLTIEGNKVININFKGNVPLTTNKFDKVIDYYIRNIGSVQLEMIYVEADSFTMGKGKGDNFFTRTGSSPEHKVTLSNDFYISKYEVTQELYKEVMGKNPSYFEGYNFPVESVDWYDSIEFCNALSERDGLDKVYKIDKTTLDKNNESIDPDEVEFLKKKKKALGDQVKIPKYDARKWVVEIIPNSNGYRLPTEAQWEYAAKGGKFSRGFKYSGGRDINDVGWYLDNTKESEYDEHGKTTTVGQKKPNELGIYDMTGNVNEWCFDWYGYYDKKDKINPVGQARGKKRVSRGGHINTSSCSVTDRFASIPNRYYAGRGIRIVRIIY